MYITHKTRALITFRAYHPEIFFILRSVLQTLEISPEIAVLSTNFIVTQKFDLILGSLQKINIIEHDKAYSWGFYFELILFQ